MIFWPPVSVMLVGRSTLPKADDTEVLEKPPGLSLATVMDPLDVAMDTGVSPGTRVLSTAKASAACT